MVTAQSDANFSAPRCIFAHSNDPNIVSPSVLLDVTPNNVVNFIPIEHRLLNVYGDVYCSDWRCTTAPYDAPDVMTMRTQIS